MAEISGKASYVRVAVLAAGLAVTVVGGAWAAGEDDLAFRLSPLGGAPMAVGSARAAAGPDAADLDRYRRIFALQAEGRMSEADALIAELGSRLLMGHVLAQRYLHPTAHVSSYDELARWLDLYADLPQATRIHKLATKRRPPYAAEPRKPVRAVTGTADSPVERVRLAALGGVVGPLRSAEPPASARASKDLAAVKAASSAERQSRGASPNELWAAGLAAWRLGDHLHAAERFAALANHGKATPEQTAAGAFWSARSWRLARRPDLVDRFLRLAASTGDPFYGRIAGEMLGDEAVVARTRSPRAELAAFGLPATRRAAALLEVGESDLAIQELTLAARRAPGETAARLTGILAELALPDEPDDTRRSAKGGKAYPIPRWEPAGGYTVDRALVWAIAKAESGLRPNAISPRGAAGLMQLMPDTAAAVARKLGVAYGGDRSLLHPPTNLRLGQAYLGKLRRLEAVGDSLIHLLLAYNAGIGRVEEWRRELAAHGDDPLLFIESVPIRETRDYVRKVLVNLWRYEAQLGYDSPSLEALAANRWPTYEQREPQPARARTDARKT